MDIRGKHFIVNLSFGKSEVLDTRERLILFPRLETCFRDGLYVPLWLHAYLVLVNKVTTKHTLSLIVIPKERKIFISYSSEETCPRCLCFLYPSLSAANISLQDAETSCFL